MAISARLARVNNCLVNRGTTTVAVALVVESTCSALTLRCSHCCLGYFKFRQLGLECKNFFGVRAINPMVAIFASTS